MSSQVVTTLDVLTAAMEGYLYFPSLQDPFVAALPPLQCFMGQLIGVWTGPTLSLVRSNALFCCPAWTCSLFTFFTHLLFSCHECLGIHSL